MVYLFPDTIKYFYKNNALIKDIEIDTNTNIKITYSKFNPFITVQGNFENIHRVRIILQEIEKNNYLQDSNTDS